MEKKDLCMPTTCPECGAMLDDGNSCQEIFDSFLVLEFTDPAYGEVHMLTVACFMIQHGKYSDEGLTWMEQKLRENLEQGISPQQIRRQSARETSQGTRTWKVTRQKGAPPQPKISWSMTIADVAENYSDAAQYRELVKKWAFTTLHEMKPLLPKP
jgi:hypothetical protein